MSEPPGAPLRLRVLTYNLQVGIATRRYTDYLTRSWRHALPNPGLRQRLDALLELLAGHDLVALQEADAGSLRTGQENLVRYLAERAGFTHHALTVTRDLRPVARHCLGLLSRHPILEYADAPLAGPVPGRRLQVARLDVGGPSLKVLATHLSLGPKAQARQLSQLAHYIDPDEPTLLLGDLNCGPEALSRHPDLRRLGVSTGGSPPLTYPSWAPRKALDHVLVAGPARLVDVKALPPRHSDHLPVSALVELPRT